jgi:hypothetical protein
VYIKFNNKRNLNKRGKKWIKYLTQWQRLGQQATVLAPMIACMGAYFVTKDPQIAALTLFATGAHAPEASANVEMAEAGFGKTIKGLSPVIV